MYVGFRIKSFETEYELIASAKHIFAHLSTAVCANERKKGGSLRDFQNCCVECDS